MPADIASMVLGTSGLSLMTVVAGGLAFTRGEVRQGGKRSIKNLASIGIVLQACHFTEELVTGFHVEFPRILGLAPWPLPFFVALNLIWIAIWVLCLFMLDSRPRLAVFPLWLLAIASLANAVAHPVMAIIVGGYFPGLWTSPIVGILGIALVRLLSRETGRN